MNEEIEIKTFKIMPYYIFCVIGYMFLLITTMSMMIYAKILFGLITPDIIKNLNDKYNWITGAYFVFIFMVVFLLILFLMYYFRKYFEKKCIFVFDKNSFSIFYKKTKYIFEIKCLKNILFYKNVTILPASISNPNYYRIVIHTENDFFILNTQIIKSMESIINISELIEKLKKYHKDLKVINNTAFFGGFNKGINRNIV